MSNNFKYQSDDYDRHSQRFVVPLYYRDELGNFLYSSTATLTQYNGAFYILFAAHAISVGMAVDDFYIFGSDGELYKLSEYSIGYRVFEDDDLVIVDCFNKRLEGKNYFNLNEDSMLGFDKKHFAWTGFPSSKCKAKEIHNTKSANSLKSQYVHTDDSGTYFKSASYYTIISKVKANNKLHITGSYEQKGAKLKYKGDVSMGPHPEGMSGGAIYFFSKGQKLKDSLDATFRFAGIGVEYKKDKTIIGVSREKVLQLFDLFDQENPVRFVLDADDEFAPKT